MNTPLHQAAMLALAVMACGGCLSVKTENEIKPIHITMDINLKVDKELDKAFSDENPQKPQGSFKAVKAMLDRHSAGLTAQGLLAERDGASDDERILIAEENARRMKRFSEIAKSSGVSLSEVQSRHARRAAERIPSGSGVWIEGADGVWTRK